MKRVFLFILCSFLLTGINAIAQDAKKAAPGTHELDELPSFKGGGPNNFAMWVSNHVRYPQSAKKAGVEGNVMVHFIIGTDGKITKAHVHEGVHPKLDAEAVRIVMKSPKWKPGMKDGKPVKVGYTMPVTFYFSN